MKIEIYGKQNCAYCNEAKAFLKLKSFPFTYTDIEDIPLDDVGAIVTKTGAKTFPIIFIDEEYIGGYRELKGVING